MCHFHENRRWEALTYKHKLRFAHILSYYRPNWVIFGKIPVEWLRQNSCGVVASFLQNDKIKILLCLRPFTKFFTTMSKFFGQTWMQYDSGYMW
jgi:hypothetical protein